MKYYDITQTFEAQKRTFQFCMPSGQFGTFTARLCSLSGEDKAMIRVWFSKLEEASDIANRAIKLETESILSLFSKLNIYDQLYVVWYVETSNHYHKIIGLRCPIPDMTENLESELV